MKSAIGLCTILLILTSGQPVLRTECLRGTSFPPPDQQRQSSFHVKVKVDCWFSMSIIDPRPLLRINRGDHLYINCQLPLCQLLIPPINRGNWLYIDHQSPLHQSSITSTPIIDPPPPGSTEVITSTLIVDHLCINCQMTPLHIFDFLVFNIRMCIWSSP